MITLISTQNPMSWAKQEFTLFFNNKETQAQRGWIANKRNRIETWLGKKQPHEINVDIGKVREFSRTYELGFELILFEIQCRKWPWLTMNKVTLVAHQNVKIKYMSMIIFFINIMLINHSVLFLDSHSSRRDGKERLSIHLSKDFIFEEIQTELLWVR